MLFYVNSIKIIINHFPFLFKKNAADEEEGNFIHRSFEL